MVTNPMNADSRVQVAVGGDASGFNGAMAAATESLVGFNKKAAAVAAGGVALLAGAMGAKSVSAAADFESAMADVQKVTDEQTADQLAGDIQELSEELPLSSSRLATLARQAGRFGVEGTENIERFVRVAGEMGAATTLSADEAGRSLAKVTEAVGEPIDNIRQLGDGINELSNNFATSSQEIVDSAQRGGFALQQLGLESDQILGLAAAMNEVSPTSRRAATSMRMVAQAVQDPENVESFANLMGVTKEQFREMRDEEPQELILELAEAMEENKDQADDLTQSLGTAQARALRKITGRSDDLADAMETSNDAMEEGGSLAREVRIETDTLSGQFELLKSKVNNVFIEIGQFLLPAVKDLVQGFGTLIDVGGDVANDIAPDVQAAFGTAEDTISDFIDSANGSSRAVKDAQSAFEDAGGAVKAAANGDWQTAFDSLSDATESAIDGIRTTLVGEGGEGGIVSALSDGLDEAQEFLQTEGGEMMSEGMNDLFQTTVEAAADFQTIMVGEDGESGVLTVMVDQATDFISVTAPELFGSAMQAIGAGIRQGIIDLTNPLRGEDSELWDMFADGSTWLINNVPKLFVGVGKGIVNGITNGFQGLVQGLIGAEEGEITKAFDSIVEDFNAGEWFVSVGTDIAGSIIDGIKGVATGEPSLQQRASSAIAGGLLTIIPDSVVPDDMTDIGEQVVDLITNPIGNISQRLDLDVFEDIGSDIVDAISDGLPGLQDVIVKLLDDELEGAADEFKKSVDINFGQTGKEIRNSITNGLNDLETDIQEAADYLIGTGPKTLVGDTRAALDELATLPTDFFRDTFNAVVPDSLDVGPVELPEVEVDAGPLGSVTIGGGTIFDGFAIDLPQIQSGGFISEGGVAEVHEGERVLPAAQVDDRGPAPADETVINIDTIEASSEAEGRAAARGLKAELQRQGI